MENKDQLIILIAEDNDGHARLLQRGFAEAGARGPVIRFKDGQEAWDYISGKSEPCLDRARPCLLLLDMRMPNMDGIEVLRRVKAEPRFKAIPVIMLTTTDEPDDISRCYALGCSDFFLKPISDKDLAGIIGRVRF
ncbi:MAG: response regulator [Elusimicrobia bacterium]|nr:response regulator [Elusimicrobiota bacterium]